MKITEQFGSGVCHLSLDKYFGKSQFIIYTLSMGRDTLVLLVSVAPKCGHYGTGNIQDT